MIFSIEPGIYLPGDTGVRVEDLGCSSPEDNTYYPLIAERVCQEIIDSGYEKRGILICGTGVGMAIAANKCRGIRAAVCTIYSLQSVPY